jgi:hypothetical protein
MTTPTRPKSQVEAASAPAGVEPCGWSLKTGPKSAVVEWGARPPPGWVGLPDLRPVYTAEALHMLAGIRRVEVE